MKIQNSGITLNVEKCVLSKRRMNFLGHILSAEGILPDPTKNSGDSEYATTYKCLEGKKFSRDGEPIREIYPSFTGEGQTALSVSHFSVSVEHK